MNRIKELRKEHNLKQEQLAKMLNVKRAAVSKYETGYVSLSDETLHKLCDIFNVSSDYILGRTEQRQVKDEKSFSPQIISIINSCSDLNEKELIKVVEYIDFLKIKKNS